VGYSAPGYPAGVVELAKRKAGLFNAEHGLLGLLQHAL